MNTTITRREILNSLHSAKPFALPESNLLTAVNTRLRPKIDADALRAALDALKAVGYVDTLATEFADEEARWLITEVGEAYLKR
jgi:hypothetical protein